jgi:hypothetical protein
MKDAGLVAGFCRGEAVPRPTNDAGDPTGRPYGVGHFYRTGGAR